MDEKDNLIYIYGDSHTSAFTGTYKKINDINKLYARNNFRSYRTAPFTIYNINHKIEDIKRNILNLNINSKDYLILCYGETDIRHHIGFHSNEANLKKNIKDIIIKYINFINELRKINNKIYKFY